jgi:NUMOD4 motif/HNH endonuclease
MTTENWAEVAGYEGSYEVSDLGRVRSLDRIVRHSNGFQQRPGRMLTPAQEAKGYLFVHLYKNGSRRHAKVHHLVANAFLARSDKPVVNHKDFNKKNNAATNLEWATPKENTHHWLAGRPGISAVEASAEMTVGYLAKVKKPAIRHPKQKPCIVCGQIFTPPKNKRAVQKACSRACAGVVSGFKRRKPESLRASKYSDPDFFSKEACMLEAREQIGGAA